MIRARIIGTGGYLPDTILTNHDVEKLCDTSDEWITKRTGIRQRHHAKEGVGSSDLGAPAAKIAIENAGIDANEIDAIIACTVTPDMVAPSTSILIQKHLGLRDIPAFDLNAACSGFLYGLATSRALIETGMYKTILLVGAETTSRLLNWDYRDTAVLFADAAGAVILRGEEGDHGVITVNLGADGVGAEILNLPSGGFRCKPTPEYLRDHPYVINMNGPELFKRAVIKFEETSKRALDDAGLAVEDIALFVPHQANSRIIDAAVQRLGLDPGKVVMNLDRVGNTVAASIPLALHEANEAGRINAGDYVLFAGFGAGLTWGAAIVKW